MIAIKEILTNYELRDEIYVSKNKKNNDQSTEMNLRTQIANYKYDNIFEKINQHHSINVMQQEVKKFLKKIKDNGKILDIGSGWCWHWKDIHMLRPDIKIFAVDMLFDNFNIAKKIVSQESKKQIIFFNENILETQLPRDFFDAVWSVQTLQHIPKIDLAIQKIFSLMKYDAILKYYNLNYNIIHILKNSPKKAWINNLYYLNRDIKEQKKILKKIFLKYPKLEYSELLFFPQINFLNKLNFLSNLDINLVGTFPLKSLLARQISFVIQK